MTDVIAVVLLVVIVLDLLRSWLAPHAAWLGDLLGFLHAAAWLWVPVYLFVMQKRIYRQD